MRLRDGPQVRMTKARLVHRSPVIGKTTLQLTASTCSYQNRGNQNLVSPNPSQRTAKPSTPTLPRIQGVASPHHQGTTRTSPNLNNLNTKRNYHDIDIHLGHHHIRQQRAPLETARPFSRAPYRGVVAVPDATAQSNHPIQPPPNETSPPRQRILHVRSDLLR